MIFYSESVSVPYLIAVPKCPIKRSLREEVVFFFWGGGLVHDFTLEGITAELARSTAIGGSGCLLISRGLRNRERETGLNERFGYICNVCILAPFFYLGTS